MGTKHVKWEYGFFFLGGVEIKAKLVHPVPPFSSFCLLSRLPFVYILLFLFLNCASNMYCKSTTLMHASIVVYRIPFPVWWMLEMVPHTPINSLSYCGCRVHSGSFSAGPHSVMCFLQAVWKQRGGRLRGVLVAAVPVHQRYDEQHLRAHSQGEGRSHHVQAAPSWAESPWVMSVILVYVQWVLISFLPRWLNYCLSLGSIPEKFWIYFI